MTTTLIPARDFAVHAAEPHAKNVSTPNVAQTVAQFEILSQPLAPVNDVPYVQQGFFVQVVNLQTQSANVTLNFVSTPAISNNPQAPIKIFADYITNDGAPVFYNAFFTAPVGFFNIPVPANGSVIFGVQYIYNPSTGTQALGTTPQQSASSRGYVTFAASLAGRYGILPTVRQVFTTFDANFKPVSFSESAYAVPLISLVNV